MPLYDYLETHPYGTHLYEFVYDFFVGGGVISSIPLVDVGDSVLPNNFVVNKATLNVIVPLDSASHTATAALSTGESAGDLKGATVVSAAPWKDVGITDLPILKKMTGDRIPTLVVAVQALTKGRFSIILVGYQSDAGPAPT